MLIEGAAIGLAAGFLAGLLGIGGGFVIVPALTWILLQTPGMEAIAVHVAVATSLATMLVTSAFSVLAHQRKGAIQWPLVRGLAPGLLLGAALGAWLADRLPAAGLGRFFGLLALVVGLQLLLGHKARAERPLPGQPALGGVGVVIGGISSLVGIGGGALTGPWQLWHGIREQRAVATSAACGYPIAVAGTLSFALLTPSMPVPSPALGYVWLPAFASIALASAVAAPLGAAAVHRLPARWVRRLFGLFLVLTGVRMTWGV
jgi:uncharacterized membrane protein YfcA